MKNKRQLWWALLALLLTLLLIWGWTKGRDMLRQRKAQWTHQEYIPLQHTAPDDCWAFAARDSVWKSFRKHFPLHFQSMVQSDFGDSSRLIILSDPSPHVELDSLITLLQPFRAAVEVFTHKIGYDGFAKDICVVLPRATAENMQNLRQKISQYLYYNDYKSPYLSLQDSLSRTHFSPQNLDYQITLYEFNQWFVEDQESFFALHDSTQRGSLPSLLAQNACGVFLSHQPGFVAWLLPKKGDLKNHLKDLRPFTLDGDLILGAVADSNTLAIIARERNSPFEELPPLQLESILLLASISEKELSQSLDVNDFLAGKMRDGRDWCPTYLSKELENTEFGDLLTLTDILLKDWSERGRVQEKDYAYPEPPHYPFPQPLFRQLGLSELVYNWNTAQAMYAIDLQGHTLYTLNRTGALPVSYFDGADRGYSVGSYYENVAYDYFAGLNNTDLVRVVQYTALYQLFIDNGITYSGNTFAAIPTHKAYLLQEPATVILKNLRALDATTAETLADSISRENFSRFQQERVEEELDKQEKKYGVAYGEQRKQEIMKEVLADSRQQIASRLRGATQMLKGLSDADFHRLCKYLSYPRGFRMSQKADQALFQQAHKLQELGFMIGKYQYKRLGVEMSEVKDFYSRSLQNSAAKYLKTPSLILTYHDLVTTGGHNLSSRINRVQSLTHYKSRTRTSPRQNPGMTPAQPPPSKGKPSSPSGQKKMTQKSTPKSTAKPTTPTSNIRPRQTVVPSGKRVGRGW